jgi:hypothetical protein
MTNDYIYYSIPQHPVRDIQPSMYHYQWNLQFFIKSGK